MHRYATWILSFDVFPRANLPLRQHYAELLPYMQFRCEDGMFWEYHAPDAQGWRQIMDGDVVFALMAYRDGEIKAPQARSLIAEHYLSTGATIYTRHMNNWGQWRK